MRKILYRDLVADLRNAGLKVEKEAAEEIYEISSPGELSDWLARHELGDLSPSECESYFRMHREVKITVEFEKKDSTYDMTCSFCRENKAAWQGREIYACEQCMSRNDLRIGL